MAPLLSSNDQNIKSLVTKNYDKIFNSISEDKVAKYLIVFLEWLAKKDHHNEGENRPLKRLSLDVR